MKPVTLRMICIGIILAIEVVVILINIPVVSLISGIVLLGIVLFVLGRSLSSGKFRLYRKAESKKATDIDPGTGMEPPKPEPVKTKDSSGPIQKNVSPAKKNPKPAQAHRFETLTTIGKGLHMLLSARSRKGESLGAAGSDKAASTTGNTLVKRESPSFASMKADAASPVTKKPEPSPFSPLEKDMILDADLIMSPKGGAGKGSEGDNRLDADLDAFDMIPPDSDLSNLDISLDDETPIIIDDEEEDEVANILEAHQDELGSAEPGDEIAIDQGFSGLEDLDIDINDLNTQVMPDSPRGIPPIAASGKNTPRVSSPAGTPPAVSSAQKSTMDRNVEDENMISFSSASSGDDDLISSLRTDISGVKRNVNSSLIRDLKDTRVRIQDIEEDLSALLSVRKKKP
jgi:hypothetical protein